MSKDAVIFGYSGHAYVVIEMLIADKYNIIGYCDNEKKEKNPFNIHYLGKDINKSVINKIKSCNAFIGIGNNKIRSEIFEKLTKNKIFCPPVIHYKSFISPTVKIGLGVAVMAGATINAMVTIGNAVICNSSSVIEHECTIGDYTHIAPGAVLAGNVTVGNSSFIGANSVVKQGIKIGSNVIIGAGSVVIRDIADGLTVYGNPAKSKRNE